MHLHPRPRPREYTAAELADMHPTQAELALKNLANWQYRENVLQRKAARMRASVPGILRSLPVGGFHVFPQYRLASQVSPAIASAKLSGGTFTSSRELSLIDGACTGVRVTRLT